MSGYVDNIKLLSSKNSNFRQVVYTGRQLQLVIMCLQPGEDIGLETHENTDQMFVVESGNMEVLINGARKILTEGMVAIVPAGSVHNLINVGPGVANFYTVYAPPTHPKGTIYI